MRMKTFCILTTLVFVICQTTFHAAGQSKVSNPVPQPATTGNVTRYPSPDDPNIERLLQQREQALRQIPEDHTDAYTLRATARRPIIEYLYDTRQAELAKLRPAPGAIQSRPNLNFWDFPELDGSTSCSNLGMIVVCRSLGVPWHWHGRPGDTAVSRVTTNFYAVDGSLYRSPNPVYLDLETRRLTEADFAKFQVFPAKSGEGYRFDQFAQMMQRSFGHFQGTHDGYLSLIGLPKNPDGTEIVPVIPRQEVPSTVTSPSTIISAPVMSVPAGRAMLPVFTQELLFPPSEILLVARKPSADELAAARAAQVELDVRPVALDAFVFLVNRKNPVVNLTLEQVREIYYHCEKGETYSRDEPNALRWSRYGGPNEKITVFERGFNSGSREIMDELVMNLRVNDPAIAEQIAKNRQRRFEPIYDSMAGPYLALAGGDFSYESANTWGIAYSVYNYEHFLACTPEVRNLAINGILPSYETIRTKQYPLVSEVYVVTKRGIAADSPAAKLRDWLLSDDGQRCVRESGYVPINPKIAAE